MRELSGSWLASYRDYIVKQESPSIFHFWVSSQMVSAALRRNIWIDRGAYIVYPNQYVILVALSGAARKSVAMEIGLDLIGDVEGIMILHERMTVEGLMDKMQRVSLMPDGRVLPDGSVLIHADELANLFGRASYITDLMSFLTAGYTSKAKMDFLTRTRSLVSVRNPCITILAGTTPEQMSIIFPSMALTSGLLGRIVMVAGTRGKRHAKPFLDEKLRDPLIHDLKEIANMHGEMVLTKDAEEAFTTWYNSIPTAPPAELIAFYERKHDHVFKMAIVISASESDEMIITYDQLMSAINAIDLAESGMPEALAYIGATAQSNVADHVFSVIKSFDPKPISHSVLLRRVYKKVQGKTEFREVIETLHDANRITIDASRSGIFYSLRKKEGR